MPGTKKLQAFLVIVMGLEDADKRAQNLNAHEKAEFVKTLMYKCAEKRRVQLIENVI